MKDPRFKLGVALLSVFMLPQLALASWWNPLSWSIWNIIKPVSNVQQISIVATKSMVVDHVSTSTEKGGLNKEVKIKEKNGDLLASSSKKSTTDSLHIISKAISATISTSSVSEKKQTYTPSCTQDIWSCSNWSMCSSSSTQTRSCNKTFECPSIITPVPAISQSCEPASLSQQNPNNLSVTNYQLTEDQIQYTINPTTFLEGSNEAINAKLKIIDSSFDYTKIKSVYFNFHNDKTDGDFSLSKGIFDNDWDVANKEFSFSMVLDWSQLRNSRLVSIDYATRNSNISYSIPITNGTQITITK